MKMKGKQKIRLMDSNDSGIITGPANRYGQVPVCLEDGLEMLLLPGEFVLVNDAEEEQLRSGKVNKAMTGEQSSRRRLQFRPSGITHGGDPVFDLHIEALPGGHDLPQNERLEYQLNSFHTIMNEQLRHRGKRFSLVHGIGDGILKERIRKELDEIYALRCTWLPGSAGITIVTVR